MQTAVRRQRMSLRILRLQPRPVNVNRCSPCRFVIFDTNGVITVRKVNVTEVVRGRMFVPFVDDQLIVNVNANAIIDAGIEAIGSGLEMFGTCPRNAKVIAGESAARATVAPIKADFGILPRVDSTVARAAVCVAIVCASP